MRVKIEQLLLVSGIISEFWLILHVFLRKTLPNSVNEFFRAGSTGGIFVGLLLLAGFIGLLFYLVNIITGVRAGWLIRFFICFVFLVFAGIAGSSY
jgi:hypothetical protein